MYANNKLFVYELSREEEHRVAYGLCLSSVLLELQTKKLL